MTQQPLVLRPKQVTAELQIGIATFWRLVKTGKIKTVKLSPRCTGILRSDLIAYLDQNRAA